MTRVHFLTCGYLHAPPNPKVGCRCLLLEDPAGLALVDTGIGVHDIRDPQNRIGQIAIEMAGFQFNEEDTAIRQIEKLGFTANDVKHIVLTHADPDHAGGLSDFPNATVHLSAEEHVNAFSGSWRYSPIQFEHSPRWQLHSESSTDWFGIEARPPAIGFQSRVLLVPLFGHTKGHCGVAVQQGDRWLLHVGDAYYLRVELETDDHPVSQLAAARADDDEQRRSSIEKMRRLHRDHSNEIHMFGYHDLSETPIQ